jgi:predicted MPP superfamily phosphohydrolase
VFASLFYLRNLLDAAVVAIVILAQVGAAMFLWRRAQRGARAAIAIGLTVSCVAVTLGFLLRFGRVSRYFPEWAPGSGRGMALAWAFLSLLLVAALAIARLLPRVRKEHSPPRRAFLRSVQTAVFGAPMAVTGYGVFIQRFQLGLREENLVIPGLPKDLDGLRLVQLTDIHLSPFLSERELERAVAMANETRAHVALVTGDLISTARDPLDACIARLAALKSDAGVFGCLGNHEIYSGAEAYAAEHAARVGIRFLRSEAALLRFGNAALNIAGVDYQRFGRKYLAGAERLVDPQAFNLLLSHNPDVFPAAVTKGFDLTVSGHTHGGQVKVEILRQDLSVARFFTPYVDGLYREGDAAIFVSRGIGTIGLPLRLGAPPEVALLRLWRT